MILFVSFDKQIAKASKTSSRSKVFAQFGPHFGNKIEVFFPP